MGEVSKVFPFFIFEAIAAKCNPAVHDDTATLDDGSCDYGTTCWDGSVECDASDCPDMLTVDVLYSTDSPIAGFQFIVTGATVYSASGGAAEDAGFQMAAGGGNNAVVGFSLTGDYIGVGEGVLTVLEIAGETASVCIENVLISNNLILIDDTKSVNKCSDKFIMAVDNYCKAVKKIIITRKNTTLQYQPCDDRLIVDYESIVNQLNETIIGKNKIV